MELSWFKDPDSQVQIVFMLQIMVGNQLLSSTWIEMVGLIWRKKSSISLSRVSFPWKAAWRFRSKGWKTDELFSIFSLVSSQVVDRFQIDRITLILTKQSILLMEDSSSFQISEQIRFTLSLWLLQLHAVLLNYHLSKLMLEMVLDIWSFTQRSIIRLMLMWLQSYLGWFEVILLRMMGIWSYWKFKALDLQVSLRLKLVK